MPSMREIWADIPGWPGYQASTLGRIRSTDRTATDGRQVRGRVLKPRPIPSGYVRVSLCIGGKKKDGYVHHLVAATFIGPRPDGLDVAHNDGDPANNRLDNLRYATRSDNQLDTREHGTHAHGRKTHCANGHEFTPENTAPHHLNPRWRVCRACRQEAVVRYRTKGT